VAFIPAANGATGEVARLIYVKPVEILNQALPGSEGRLIRVSFEQACGETFHGILVSESPKQVRLGVAVNRPATQCSALPVRQELVVPVATKGLVKSIALTEPKRIMLQDVLDVAFSGHALTASWQDTCRQTLGILMAPVSGADGRRLGIYIAELPEARSPAHSRTPACAREIRRGSISSFRVNPNEILLSSRPGHLRDLFSLKLRAASKVSLSDDGQLNVTYDAQCKEKAVGVLFSGKSGNDIAVMTAFAPNTSCLNSQRAMATYTVKAMRIARGQKVQALSREQVADLSRRGGYSFRLLPVTSVKTTRQGSGDWLLAGAPLTCAERLGLIVGEDSLGNFSMASVTSGGETVCELSHVVSGQTLTAPLVGTAEGPMAKVFALKVFGTPVN
jgi:hypothetical protein